MYRKQKVSMCIMLGALLVYRKCIHKMCVKSFLLANTTTTTTKKELQPIVLTEQDELASLLLADDIRLADKVPCGKDKCFFQSKSDKRIGYLIARCDHDEPSNPEKMERIQEGWELATLLEQKYQIKHFLASPPETVAVSEHLGSLLNQNLWFETQDKTMNDAVKKRYRTRYPLHTPIFVQKVKVAPTPNLLLACAESNRPHFERHLPTFLMNVRPKFLQKFQQNLQKTRELLEAEPSMIKDFQVLVDDKGEIYHLDFDRAFHHREQDETKPCFDYLNQAERQIQTILQDPLVPDNIDTSISAPCGKEKCFFRTKSNETVGYLVAISSEKDNRHGRFDSLNGGWKLAEQLRQDHGIEHFLLAPPANVTVTSELEVPLNKNLWMEANQKVRKSSRSHFPEGHVAYVQKVQAAPEPNLLLGCAASKMTVFEKLVDKFVASVPDKEAFGRRFHESYEKARTLLREEPCLYRDFQVLVDEHGDLYQLDFDRCFVPTTGEKKTTNIENFLDAPCAHHIDEIEQRVQLALENATQKKKTS